MIWLASVSPSAKQGGYSYLTGLLRELNEHRVGPDTHSAFREGHVVPVAAGKPPAAWLLPLHSRVTPRVCQGAMLQPRGAHRGLLIWDICVCR